jgi:hypothetical protein
MDVCKLLAIPHKFSVYFLNAFFFCYLFDFRFAVFDSRQREETRERRDARGREMRGERR